MDINVRRRLLGIASGGLLLAGIIFIVLSIFSETKDNMMLFAALFCSVLAGLFNIIRTMDKK